MCDPALISPVAEVIKNLNPQSVLDVGTGLGKWGLIAREYTDIWHGSRHDKAEWQTKIIGLELQKQKRSAGPNVYTAIYPGDLKLTYLRAIEEFGPFDLTLVIGVLDTLTPKDACALLGHLSLASKNILVGYSSKNRPEKKAAPLSTWSAEVFDSDFKPVATAPDDSWGVRLFTQELRYKTFVQPDIVMAHGGLNELPLHHVPGRR